MIRSYRINRAASVAILLLMTLAVVYGARLTRKASQAASPPAEGLLVVANLRAESLTFADPESPGATKTLSVFGPPHEMVTVAGRLYVALGRGNALIEVDPRAPGILRTLAIEGEPHGLALDGDDLLVTLDRGNALVRVDRVTLVERERAPTGDTPHAVAVAGGDIYVAESREDRLRMIASGEPTSVQTGALPESIALAGEFVVTADSGSGTLSVFAPGLEVIGQVKVGGSPVRVVALDATHVVAALNDRGEVVVVDLHRLRVSRRVKVGGRPDGLCASPSGAYIGVASNAAGTLQVFRLRDWKLVTTLAAGDGPGACAWLPGR